jgi:glycosyltransferase involved in cell wall biosynthesis
MKPRGELTRIPLSDGVALVLAKESEIKLSIALVTMNRPQSLELSLQKLREQSLQPYELIVSDDSDLQYQSQVQAITERWKGKYVRGPHRGLCANRNHSALLCSGTHIRTMDDDHRLPRGHLESCLESIRSDKEAIWTVGESGFLDGKHIGTLPTANQLHPSGVGTAVENLDDNWAIADGSTIYPAKIFHLGHRMIYLYSHGFKSRCIQGALVEHYANEATLTRAKQIDSIESCMFSSLCFNLYFRRNKYLAFKYALSCLLRSGFDPQLIRDLPLTVQRAQTRWAAFQ